MLGEYIERIFREYSENIGRILRKYFGTNMNESWNIYGSFERRLSRMVVRPSW